MDRRGKAAGGGGKGVGVSAFAFLCQVCGMGFQHVDELQIHSLTDHAALFDKDMDASNPNPPKSFVQTPNIGPQTRNFTAFDAVKIQKMLDDWIHTSPETLKMPNIPSGIAVDFSRVCGEFRGIEGNQNSCYFDVFFMILAFSNAFDGIFTQKALNESILLRIILSEVVIPLRTRMFVNRDVIAMIRHFLADASRKREYLGGLVDFTEFLMNLSENVSFSSIAEFIHDGSIECNLVIPIIQSAKVLQNVLNDTLTSRKVQIKSAPSAFFLRVRPDFGSKPSALPQMNINVVRSSYGLSAIVCIRRSHYVSFLRLQNGEWVFFDSMHGMDNGHCVPTLTYVPGFQAYIESGCKDQQLILKSDARDSETRNSFHELVTLYAYAYLFTINGTSTASSEPPAACVKVSASPKPQILQKSSAGGAAAIPCQHRNPSQKSSAAAGGGGAAIPCQHRPPPSFGHSQSTQQSQKRRIPIVDGSDLPPLICQDSFYKAVTDLIIQHDNPVIFKITGLSLVSAELHANGILLFGSFGFIDDTGFNYRYRVVGFKFDDETETEINFPVDDLKDPEAKKRFVEEVEAKWETSMITSVIVKKCQ